MALYAISDLHLSLGTDKPMDVFGVRWENYTEKLQNKWLNKIKKDDVVLIPGDISWATYIEDAYKDFEFINNLPGTKIILKGNHDYWWTTQSKMEKFFTENDFLSIKILQNNSYLLGRTAVCGTRGWSAAEKSSGEDRKIFDREKIRLLLSLEDAKRKNPSKIIVMLHYPPIFQNNREIFDILKEYRVDECIYGHLHGKAHSGAPCGNIDGIELKLVSGDYIDFDPIFLEK